MATKDRLKFISEGRQKSIVAMKGAPLTRKTEFATLIAASLSCPLLSVEDFLDVLGPDNVQISPSPSTLTPLDLAFRIICQMAESHLSNALSDNVVVDSPLSSRPHLDQLIKLASSMEKTRLVIVECKPKNTYLWQMRVEPRLRKDPHVTSKWWKAKNWDEVVRGTTQQVDDGYHVSKLILDPLLDYNYFPKDVLRPSPDFEPPLFMEAVSYMMTREEGDGPNVVVYRQWQLNSKGMETQRQGYHDCRGSHTITKYTEESGPGYEDVVCRGCAKVLVVKGGAYTCNKCRLALHKECAESFEECRLGYPYELESSGTPVYTFPEEFGCASCKEDGKAFSDECASCLFETHLKCHLMPTVIKHACDQHILSITLLPTNAYKEVQMCFACGTKVGFVFYTCKICCTYYHIDCLNEIPSRVKHKHGGHHHLMLLKFNDCDKADDYICDECLSNRDPERWFYSCKDCHYYVHLRCVFSTIIKRGFVCLHVPARRKRLV